MVSSVAGLLLQAVSTANAQISAGKIVFKFFIVLFICCKNSCFYNNCQNKGKEFWIADCARLTGRAGILDGKAGFLAFSKDLYFYSMPPIKFDWDAGNEMKNATKHKVLKEEAESVFNDERKIVAYDHKHSSEEMRFECLGKSLNNRILRVTFVTRTGTVRIVSARPASVKEKKRYETQ